ncbi:MAG: hypothetical protein J5497_00765, partial [Selenomonadaceae bacterium]|nr:hypothetical protein [Selenomonadaceae bacterium]
TEIALSGAGDIIIGGKTFTTSDEFTGSLQIDSAGNVYSADYFVGTLSDDLGGLELAGLTIESHDNFSVTSDGEKITAIENLQNGTLTGGDFDSVTINGEIMSFDDSGTITIAEGKLKGATETVDTDDDAEEISDMFTGDADKIVAAKGRATIKNYDHTSGEAFTTEYENIASAVKESLIAYDDGRLTVNSAKIIFDDDADSRIINFVDADGNVQKVGFANENASLDASDERGNLILVGKENSALTSGAGNDTIFADEGSLVDAGAGKNLVELSGGDAIVELSGNTTVTGFNDSDELKTSTDNLKLQFDGKNLIAKNNSSKVTFEDVSNKISIVDGEETLTAYIAQDDEIISVDEPADIYFGNNSGVDFSNYDENLSIDLSENFHGVNKITAGDGRNTIIGSKANETLTAGKYDNSIYGGGGINLLQGYTGEDKIGHATFFALEQNDGAVNVIEKFEFVEPGNYLNAADVTADAIDTDIENNRFSNVAITEDGGILLEVTNNSSGSVEKILVTGAITDAGYSKDFVVNGIVAQVGDNLVNVDRFAEFYLANGVNATAHVDSSVTGELSIWL